MSLLTDTTYTVTDEQGIPVLTVTIPRAGVLTWSFSASTAGEGDSVPQIKDRLITYLKLLIESVNEIPG